MKLGRKRNNDFRQAFLEAGPFYIGMITRRRVDKDLAPWHIALAIGDRMLWIEWGMA